MCFVPSITDSKCVLFIWIRCEIIILAPVAIIIAARTSLLASQRVVDITQYMSRTQNFNMKNLTGALTKLLSTTDPKHLTGNVCYRIVPYMLYTLIWIESSLKALSPLPFNSPPSPYPSLPLSLPPFFSLASSPSPPILTAVGGFADLALKHGLKTLDLDSTQKLRANTAASVGVPVLTLPKGTCAAQP